MYSPLKEVTFDGTLADNDRCICAGRYKGPEFQADEVRGKLGTFGGTENFDHTDVNLVNIMIIVGLSTMEKIFPMYQSVYNNNKYHRDGDFRSWVYVRYFCLRAPSYFSPCNSKTTVWKGGLLSLISYLSPGKEPHPLIATKPNSCLLNYFFLQVEFS